MNSSENRFSTSEMTPSEMLRKSTPSRPMAEAETPATVADSTQVLPPGPTVDADSLTAKINRAVTFVVAFMIAVVLGVCLLSAGNSKPGPTTESKSVLRLANPVNLVFWLAGSEHDLSDIQDVVTDSIKASHEDLQRSVRANAPVFDQPIVLSGLNGQPAWKPQGNSGPAGQRVTRQNPWP